jgi:hypothetical protein
MDVGVLSVGKSGWGVKLTTQLQLTPKSRKRGSTLRMSSWRNALSIKYRDNFILLHLNAT